MDKKVLRVVVIAFLAAVISATGFLRIMLPGMQSGIVIQNAMCILTAVLIGGIFGAAPTALFFIVGVIGVPIFAGWTGGFSVLTNVNGGFRIGWVFGALVAGLISGKADMEEKQISVKYVVRITIAVFAGMLALYIPEIFYVIGFNADSVYTPELVEKLGLDAAYTGQQIGAGGALKMFVSMFFAPFLLVDSIKAVVVILLTLKLRPVVAQYFY